MVRDVTSCGREGYYKLRTGRKVGKRGTKGKMSYGRLKEQGYRKDIRLDGERRGY